MGIIELSTLRVTTHTLHVECDIGKIGSEFGGYVSTHTLQVECDGKYIFFFKKDCIINM